MNRKPRKEHAPNIAPLTMWAKNLRLIEIDKNPASQKMSTEKLRHLLPGLCNLIILNVSFGYLDNQNVINSDLHFWIVWLNTRLTI